MERKRLAWLHKAAPWAAAPIVVAGMTLAATPASAHATSDSDTDSTSDASSPSSLGASSSDASTSDSSTDVGEDPDSAEASSGEADVEESDGVDEDSIEEELNVEDADEQIAVEATDDLGTTIGDSAASTDKDDDEGLVAPEPHVTASADVQDDVVDDDLVEPIASTVLPLTAPPVATVTAARAAATSAAPIEAERRVESVALSVPVTAMRTGSTGSSPLDTSPSSLFAGLLEWARRQTRYALFDRAPTASPIQISQNEAGAIVGAVGATDPDGHYLSYVVTGSPAKGDVVVNPDGSFTYSPDTSFADSGGRDVFTVQVADNVRALIVIDADGRWRLNWFNKTEISVDITVTESPVASVEVGSGPSAVALSADGKTAYVTNADANSLSIIDTATRRVTATISDVGNYPLALAVSPDGETVYVAGGYGNSVAVIDTETETVVKTIGIGLVPADTVLSGLALSPDGQRLYVTDFGGDSVAVIDTELGTVIARLALPAGSAPGGLAFASNGSRVYVANTGTDTVSVIDTAERIVVATVDLPAGTSPTAVATSPDGRVVYVAGFQNGTVTAIDTGTQTITNTFYVSSSPSALAVSPDGQRLFVADDGTNAVAVIELASATVTSIAVGSNPGAVAVRPDGAELFVPNFESNSLSVVSLQPGAPAIGAQLVGYVLPAITVYNFSQYPLKVINLSGVYLNYLRELPPSAIKGPGVATIIEPGRSVGYALDTPPFGRNQYTLAFMAPSATETVYYEISAVTVNDVGLGNISCAAAGGTCTRAIKGALQIIEFNDPPGTIIEVPAGQGQEQAEILNDLCAQGSLAKCNFKPTREERTLGLRHQVGTTIRNPDDAPLTRQLQITDTQTETSSVQISAKASFKVFEIVNSEITTTFSQSWTRTHTFTESLTITVRPHFESRVFAEQPVYRYWGDFTVTMGNTTWILRDVYFDTPRTDGREPTGVYENDQQPLPPVVLDGNADDIEELTTLTI